MAQKHIIRRHFLAMGLAGGLAGRLAGGVAAPFISHGFTKAGFADDSADGLNLEAALSPRIIGDPDAPILIAEYFSMTCGYCANFHLETFPAVKKNWIDTGKARFESVSYTHLTLPTIHLV